MSLSGPVAFGLLLRTRLRMTRNLTRVAPKWQKAIAAGLTLCAAALFLLIAVVCDALVQMAQGVQPISSGLSSEAAGLVGRIEDYLFFFLLAGSVPFVAATLFQADDLPLLLSAPTSPRAIVGAKLLDAVIVNAAQFMALGVPAIVGLGWALHLGFSGWLWLLLSTLLLLVLPPSATAALLLGMARLLGMRRMRLLVMLVSVGLGLAITSLAVVGASRATRSGALDPGRLQAILRGEKPAPLAGSDLVNGRSLSGKDTMDQGSLSWLPSSWATAMLQDTVNGQPMRGHGLRGLGLLLLTTALLIALCLQVGPRVMASEAFLEQSGGEATITGGAKHSSPRLFGLSPPISGLLIKDLKYVRRDLILLGQIGTALILFFVPFLLKIAQGSAGSADNDVFGYLSLAMLVIIAYMVTSIVSLTSVGLEGRAGWMVLAAPIARTAFLRAKWLLAFNLSAGVVVGLALLAWLAFRWEWHLAVEALLVLVCACFALSGLGVGLAGLFPRFIYENPAHRASIWALIWGFVLATGYLIVCGLIGGGAYWVTTQGIAARTVAIMAVLLFLLVTLATGLIPVALAGRRLKNYEWEH